MDNIYNALSKKIDKQKIYLNEPMSKHTSFKIGGVADVFIKASNIEELKYIIQVSKANNIPLTVIGNGSNVLVKDRGNKRDSCKSRS